MDLPGASVRRPIFTTMVTLMVVLSHFAQTRPLAILLSQDGQID